ncbi:hypothetical protein CCR95_07410 [Thiocystis minor]|uniref:hypothetical protein n=1 Tax=Thiocystis minor TaxID=61597 RepID=UPI0019118AF5|nr:hypothetical protein [Thiocystis minor]MBK5963920.1 hypothetical protein [Thiocystis minor]
MNRLARARPPPEQIVQVCLQAIDEHPRRGVDVRLRRTDIQTGDARRRRLATGIVMLRHQTVGRDVGQRQRARVVVTPRVCIDVFARNPVVATERESCLA